MAVEPSGFGQPRWVKMPEGETALLTAEDAGDQEAAEALLERLRAAHHLRPSSAFRPLAGAVDGSRVVIASEPPQGASLRTLLRFVPLTADQATLVVEGLLAALATLHRAGIVQGDLSAERVYIAAEGGVRLSGVGLRPQEYPPDFSSDLAAAGGLVDLIASKVTPQVDVASWAAAVSGRLRAASQPGSANGALLAWRRGHPMDRARRQRVRDQLGALAANLPGRPPTPMAPPPAPRARVEPGSAPVAEPPTPSAWVTAASEPATVSPAREPASRASLRWTPPAERPPGSPPEGGPAPPTPRPPEWTTAPTRSRRGWPLAALVLVPLLVIAGVASSNLLAHGGSTRGQPQSAASPGSTPHASAKAPTPAPTGTSTGAAPGQIPLLGPPSNAPVQQVQLSASCASSGSCSVTIKAELGSHSATTVTWKLDRVDRCSGQVTTVATGAIPAPAYYTYVEAQPQVTIPSGSSVALVGLAGAPSDAASAPLEEGPGPAGCPS